MSAAAGLAGAASAPLSPPGPGKPDWAREGADWPIRATSRFVRAGGLDWHVQIAGEGPAVVLLHGAGASSHSWRDVAPLCARAALVIAPDLPGHGFTQTPRGRDLALPAMAAAVSSLIEALGVAPTLIVGHSAGAAVALRMALDGRVRPAGIVGFNAALRPFPGAAGRVFPALARLLFLNPVMPHVFAARARDPAAIDRLLRQTGSTLDPVGVDLYARLFRCPGHVSATLGMMSHWDLEPLQAALPGVHARVRLVTGDNDQAVIPEVSEAAAARLPHAVVTPWAGVGHLAHEERPAAAADVILEAVRASVP